MGSSTIDIEFNYRTLRFRLSSSGFISYTEENNGSTLGDQGGSINTNSLKSVNTSKDPQSRSGGSNNKNKTNNNDENTESDSKDSLRSSNSTKTQETSSKNKKRTPKKTQNTGASEQKASVTVTAANAKRIANLELYKNDCVQAYMHMYHLYNEKGPDVHQCLVNMLYNKRTKEEIQFYLPQLCQLSLSNVKSPLYQFLLDKSLANIHFGLELSWLYHGAIDQNSGEEHDSPKADLKKSKEKDGGTNNKNDNNKTNNNDENTESDSKEGLEKENDSDTSFLDRKHFVQSLSKEQDSRDSGTNTEVNCTSLDLLKVPEMPDSVKYNTSTLTIAESKTKLPGVYSTLGDPLDIDNYPALEYSDDLTLELQKLMNKEQNSYFSTITRFVDLCIEVSSKLIRESNKGLREPLVKVFVDAVNEWMLLRRCSVAGYLEEFRYRGLSLPFEIFNKSEGSYSQIIRIVEEETQVFLSKKRAPFVFYVEIANLDEDIENISLERDKKDFRFKDLYVYDSIVNELVAKNLISKEEAQSINNPLECIRYVLKMLPKESMGRSSVEKFNDKDNYDKSKAETQDETSTVATSVSSDDVDGDLVDEESFDSESNSDAVKLSGDGNKQTKEEDNVDGSESNEENTVDPSYGNEDRGESGEGDDVENSGSGTDDRSGSGSGSGSGENSGSGSSDGRSSGLSNSNEATSSNSNESQSSESKDDNQLKTDQMVEPIDQSSGSRTPEVDSAPKEGQGSKEGSEKVEEMEDNKEERKETKPNDIKNLSPEEVRKIVFPETFEQKKERIRRKSPYGVLKSWDLFPFVVKGDDDLRQEKMANQVIKSFQKIFEKAELALWLKPIQILVTSSNSVIMEYVEDSYSVDMIKRKFNVNSLAPIFEKLFDSDIEKARKNFIESHAAYSIIAYLLRVKDRHNGNILLDHEGHAIHIDYEFCFSNTPGKFINFEKSAFKLSNEYLDVIGGEDSHNFKYFKELIIKGLLEARKHVDEIVLLVEMMTTANKMPCFEGGTSYTIKTLKERFMLNLSEEDCIKKITEMINSSINTFSTLQYDTYQRITNGIK